MNILQHLSSIRELPTLPEVMLRIQMMISREDSNAKMLSKIIEQDPALASKILKIANSSFYGAAQRISSVPLAITRIGFNEVSHIAMAASVIKKFSSKSNILDYKQFWRHALTAAFLNSMVPKVGSIEFSPAQRQSLFLAGLLHDIGILIYDQFFHKEFESIIEYALKNELSFLEAEQVIAARETHATLGAALLELWKMDQAVISSVRFHHSPAKAPLNHKAVVASTYLSEYVLCNSGLGSFEGFINNGERSIIHFLGISQEMLVDFLKEAEYDVERSDLIVAFDTSADLVHLRSV